MTLISKLICFLFKCPLKAKRKEAPCRASCRTGGVLGSHGRTMLCSPMGRLTSGFGMGPGVAASPLPPDHAEGSLPQSRTTRKGCRRCRMVFLQRLVFLRIPIEILDKTLDLLVPLSCTHRCASTCGLSTSWSIRGLTSSSEWEISSWSRFHA